MHLIVVYQLASANHRVELELDDKLELWINTLELQLVAILNKLVANWSATHRCYMQ